MIKNLHINIDEITRVEGHGNVVVDIKKGRVREARFEIVESPRFFEMMLKGRRYDEAHHIMSRICGICAISHTSASLKAIEAAMGMKITRQAELLRRLAFSGEIVQSHILHLFFLVFPDFLGALSIAPLLDTHPQLVKTGLRLKRLANELCSTISGRHIHPISLFPGGVVHTPLPKELKRLKAALAESFEDLEYTLDFLSKIKTPLYIKPREFISLKARKGYAAYDGVPVSSMDYSITPDNYTKKIKEYVVSHSTAKQAKSPKGVFMVGALARVSNSFKQLGPRAKKAASKASFRPPFDNPFLNNMAQLIECFHMTEESIGIIESLLAAGPRPEPVKKPRSYGRGIGIVEAPRGTLYHDYTIGKDGLIEKADCVIPTAQNLRSIEEDLACFVPTILDKPRDVIKRSIESLVRAYDPCISCSTHFMDVKFV